MSIIDYELKFSDEQNESTMPNSENVYDRGAASAPLGDNDMIAGRPMYLEMQVGTAINLVTSLTVQFVSSAAAALTSPVVHAEKTILLADLTANSRHLIGVPSGELSLRYLGVIYTQNGTPATTGTVSAALVTDPDSNPIP